MSALSIPKEKNSQGSTATLKKTAIAKVGRLRSED